MSELTRAELIGRLREVYGQLCELPEYRRTQIAEAMACVAIRCALVLRNGSEEEQEQSVVIEKLGHKIADLARSHSLN